MHRFKDGKTVLEELTGQRKEEAEDDDLDWEEEVLGAVSYTHLDTDCNLPIFSSGWGDGY